jgi:type IV pilus assembly protein PilC
MLVTGEKTGRLGMMMENVATYYEEEQKNLVQRLKSLVEPVMIIMLAGVVGVILMAIFIPMFSMYGNIL